MNKPFIKKVKRLQSRLSAPKYRSLSGKISLFAISIATLILHTENFLTESMHLTPLIFSKLLQISLFFPLGMAGMIVTIRGELRQAFVIIRGKQARIMGTFWWLFSWWMALKAFFSIAFN